MRILAIGDIHGCSVAFDTLLAAVKPQLNDQIITLVDTPRSEDTGILKTTI